MIAGGILLGTDNLNDWGQPLIFAGGVVGFAGAIMLYNSNKYIGLAGGTPPEIVPPEERIPNPNLSNIFRSYLTVQKLSPKLFLKLLKQSARKHLIL